MVFIETLVFTRQVRELLSDEEYAEFQWFLMDHPQAGDVIEGTGELRKVRWRQGGSGKSGGVRVIYYVVGEAGQLRMLLIYRKGVQDDLTPEQRKALKTIKDRWR